MAQPETVQSPVSIPGIAEWLVTPHPDNPIWATMYSTQRGLRADLLQALPFLGYVLAKGLGYVGSALTGKPATIEPMPVWDNPWEDPIYVRSQLTLGREVDPQTLRQVGITPDPLKQQRVREQNQTLPDATLPNPWEEYQQQAGAAARAALAHGVRVESNPQAPPAAAAQAVANLQSALFGSAQAGRQPPQAPAATEADITPWAGAQPLPQQASPAPSQHPSATPQWIQQHPEWLANWALQQVQTEILGAGSYGTALREAAREAAQSGKLPVADVYWYQGVLPALQQLGASEDFLQRKYAELQQQEQEWRHYGMPGDFADWLWSRGWTLYR